MKKIISVLLAALLLFSGISVIAIAADSDDSGFKAVYTVRAADNSADKIRIVGVYGRNEVTAGETFYFTIDYLGRYRPDQTTVIKAFPASFPADLVGSYEDSTEIIIITPDPSTGIYAIPNVQEDWCIAAYSLQEDNFSSLKDMLMNLISAIVEFFANLKNLFGLAN
ncbi:MAG: hypothetical protein J1E34_02415 [Oscillospiraceae bacterium]|nr:hypothetical protein [Oscillospiraceae bacterium]